jgi:hypothetical protein
VVEEVTTPKLVGKDAQLEKAGKPHSQPDDEAVTREDIDYHNYITRPKNKGRYAYNGINPNVYMTLLNDMHFEGKRDLAIVLSKADLLPETESYKTLYLNDINHQNKKINTVFDFDKFGRKSKLLKDTFQKKKLGLHIAEDRYNLGYFAVSALGNDPIKEIRGKIENNDRLDSEWYCPDISPKCLKEPFMWLILKQMKKNGDLE